MTQTRKLGEQERLLHYLHGFGGLIATQVMHIRGPLDPDLVRRALDWLQSQHPILRAHIRYGGLVFRNLPPFVYRQPWFSLEGTGQIPLQVVDDADPEAWRRILAKELRTPIKRGRHPRLRATLVRTGANAERQHVVICADHATLDAQAGNMLSRQFLEFLADPAAAANRTPLHTSLPPALEEGQPVKPDSGNRGYQPAIRLPKLPLPKPVMETRVEARRVDPETTAALKAAIGQHRTTLHGAITAAFLLAIRQRYNLPEMTILTTVDLRRLMKPALPPETYGCYIDILRTKHTIAPDLWTTARDASFRFITTLARDQKSASILKLFDWEVYRAEMKGMTTQYRRIDGLAVTTAGESGIRRYYGRFELEDISMAVSLDMFGPSLFVIASEREGGIDLSVGYSAGALDGAEALALADAAVANLREAA